MKAALLPLALLAACSNVEEGAPPEQRPSAQPVAVDPDASAEAAATAVTSFAGSFLTQQLEARPAGENVAFSPLSISGAFALLEPGARGATRGEMRDIFAWGGERAPVVDSIALDRGLQARDDGATLSISNALWLDEGFTPLAAYRDTFDRAGAEVRTIEMNDGGVAAPIINGWVAERTENRIKDLVPPSIFTVDSRLVITNAVYFLADWDTPFNAALTREAPFQLAGGGSVAVPMMSARRDVRRVSGDGFDAVDLDYKGGALAMTFVRPAEGGSTADVTSSLDLPALFGNLDAARPADTQLTIPKVELKDRVDLKPALSALGMPTAFSKQADLSGISDTQKLFVSAALHQAFLRIDEKGTEAAAATAVMASVESMPFDFRLDRPYLFFIRDRGTGTILFAGRIADPSQD